MERQPNKDHETPTWQAESLRVTTFHALGAYSLDSIDWWEQVVESKPEQIVTRPRERLVQQSGVFETGQLVLTGRPDRVDWNLQAVFGRSGEPMQGFPSLGPFLETASSFDRVFTKWLAVGPASIRLAFGAVLSRNAEDLASAYKDLSRFLPGVDLSGVEVPDFLYSINRPRTLPDGIRINRINKWSVMQGGAISIGMGPGNRPELASELPDLACRLELDINTAPKSLTSIPSEEATKLFEKLVELGIEITEKGDIP